MPNKSFIENVDYYFFEGKIIMTEHYLKKRGYCCGNGCINCPYDPRAVKNNTVLRDKNNLEDKNNVVS